MVVSRESVNNLFIEKMYYNPFHVDESVIDAYYEAAHKGGFCAKFFYASVVCKYMNISISHALKSLDNCVYVVQGTAEPNESAIVDEYQKVNPAIETAVIKEAKHLPHLENPENFLEQVGIFF